MTDESKRAEAAEALRRALPSVSFEDHRLKVARELLARLADADPPWELVRVGSERSEIPPLAIQAEIDGVAESFRHDQPDTASTPEPQGEQSGFASFNEAAREVFSNFASDAVALRQAVATHLRYLDGEVVDGLRSGRHTPEVAANIAEHQSRNLRETLERSGQLSPDGYAGVGFIFNGTHPRCEDQAKSDTASTPEPQGCEDAWHYEPTAEAETTPCPTCQESWRDDTCGGSGLLPRPSIPVSNGERWACPGCPDCEPQGERCEVPGCDKPRLRSGVRVCERHWEEAAARHGRRPAPDQTQPQGERCETCGGHGEVPIGLYDGEYAETRPCPDCRCGKQVADLGLCVLSVGHSGFHSILPSDQTQVEERAEAEGERCERCNGTGTIRKWGGFCEERLACPDCAAEGKILWIQIEF